MMEQNIMDPGSNNMDQQQQMDQPMSERDEYAAKVEQEMNTLPGEFPLAKQILENELFRIRGGIGEWMDVINNRKVKVRARVSIPTEQFPRINFVGKLLGPKGSTLKAVQEQTMTKMAVLGQGSMRNEEKEMEMLNSGDPKYQHLKQRLHLQIDSLATPEESYYRLSHALAEVKKIMQPDESEMAMFQQGNGFGMGMGGGFGGGFGGGRGGGGGGMRGGRGGGMRGGRGGGDSSGGFRGGMRGGGRGGRGGGDRGRGGPGGGFRGGRGGGRGRGGGGGFAQDDGQGGYTGGGDMGNYDQSGGGGKMPRGRGSGGVSHPYARGR